MTSVRARGSDGPIAGVCSGRQADRFLLNTIFRIVDSKCEIKFYDFICVVFVVIYRHSITMTVALVLILL